MAVVVVTGGTGFIGRHVLPLLLERGHQVRALARTGSEAKLVDEVEPVRGDVTDPAAIEKLVRGAEIVIHLAGVAHTDLEGAPDRERARRINVDGARNLLETSLRQGVRRVVLASSVHVYEGQAGCQVREDSKQGAENFYAETKIELERISREFAGRMEIVIGRPCLTYGPNVGYNLLKLMQAIDRGVYVHAGSARVERSFGSVYSAAAAFVHMAEKGVPGEAYNIADRTPVSLEDFTNDLADRMKRPRPKRAPAAALWAAAAGFSALKSVGVKGPITLDSIKKLIESFSVSTDKLAATSFEWPDSGVRAKEDMVRAYRGENSR